MTQAIPTYQDWVKTGEPILYRYTEHGEQCASWIFTRIVRELGVKKPWLTLLHGFPTSSYDWAQMEQALKPHFHLLYVDFLGFGASDKPKEHAYSIVEQADILRLVWEEHAVDETAILAHGYGVSVVQELLARRAAGRKTRPRLSYIVFFNGVLYPDLYSPRALEAKLSRSVMGALMAPFVKKEQIFAHISESFVQKPSGDILEALWQAISHENGHKILNKLLTYPEERLEHKGRWEGAFEGTRDIPMGFIWGMGDSVAGSPVAEKIRQARPDCKFFALKNVGHYPQLEAPENAAKAVISMVIAPDETEEKSKPAPKKKAKDSPKKGKSPRKAK